MAAPNCAEQGFLPRSSPQQVSKRRSFKMCTVACFLYPCPNFSQQCSQCRTLTLPHRHVRNSSKQTNPPTHARSHSHTPTNTAYLSRESSDGGKRRIQTSIERGFTPQPGLQHREQMRGQRTCIACRKHVTNSAYLT